MKNYKGITLIALVVTIVVLLILAAVSISMLGGENGIITHAQKSKDATEQAKVQEIVDLAINALISENNGSSDGITPKNIADKINVEYSQYEKVHAEDENNFPTKIIFPEEGNREVNVDLSISTGDIDKIYDEDISEEDIAPTDIFEYEIISDAETGATSLDSLPTKEARILRIKPEYCNNINGGYTTDTGEKHDDTHYEIILEDGSKITDTLVIPYQVEINGEMYKITEAKIMAAGYNYQGELSGFCFPKVKTIIFPNTIEKVVTIGNDEAPTNTTISKIVLPKKLSSIETKMFFECQNLTDIEIPNSVTNIGEWAFRGCSSLTNIKIPNGVTSIGEYTFYQCTSLTSIEIPSSVTSIGNHAFNGCSSLTTVNYTGTMEQWKQINISSYSNNNLTNAKIICTDGTIN